MPFKVNIKIVKTMFRGMIVDELTIYEDDKDKIRKKISEHVFQVLTDITGQNYTRFGQEGIRLEFENFTVLNLNSNESAWQVYISEVSN